MDKYIALAKFQETALEFESLAQMFSGRINIPNILEKCQTCINNVESMLSMETNNVVQIALNDVMINVQSVYRELLERPPQSSETRNNNNYVKKGNKSETPNDLRRDAIKSTLRQTCGNGLNDIAGLNNVKNELRKTILLPIQFPSLFIGSRKPSAHILLYGPPGNGKSSIASAIAEEANVQFYSISSADLLSSWVGESEKTIKELFEYTRGLPQKCIVFIDEIDSICRKRSDKEADHSRRMKNQLLVELDANMSNPQSNCLVISATNCPWDIDIAFLRRFQSRIYVPLPDRIARLNILKMKTEGVGLDMSDSDWEIVVNRTEGYTGSDIASVASYAIQEPISELAKCETWTQTNDSKWVPCSPTKVGCFNSPLALIPPDKVSIRNVKLKDFTKAILIIPKTVSNSDLEKYKTYSI